VTRSRTPALLLTAVLLTACTGGPSAEESAADAAQALVAGLQEGTLGGVAPVRGTPADARALVGGATEELGEQRRVTVVDVGEVTETGEGEQAEVSLRWRWQLPVPVDGEAAQWSHPATAVLQRTGDQPWRVRVDEGLVGLRAGETFAVSRVAPERGDVLGADDAVLVEDRPVLRFGIDKTRGAPAAQQRDARRLARIVDIDAGVYAEQVAAAGEAAFVEAIVLREADATGPLQAVADLDTVLTVADTLPLAPTREFARPLLGTVGEVTAEIVEASDGAYRAGDTAGLSGLQARYDERLRGSPGVVVAAVREGRGRDRELHEVTPTAGEPLTTTLDPRLQARAEEVLADVGPAAALVAVQPSTGALRAVASGPGGAGYSTATVGQYAPGSTFKIVTSLALLRDGVAPGDPLPCPPASVVDGKRFENYDDYPASGLGRITLRGAVADSCNTAFIEARERAGALVGAAEALGLGVDHDLGFPAYLGAVPDPGSATATGEAAAMIGQSEVLASPMAMAGVLASVVAGETVVPHLLVDQLPAPAPADPLTPAEARSLRGLLRGVVATGSGQDLADLPGPPALAKTGTAEFGDEVPPRTHAWMVGAQGDLAVAVFVEEGDSGSGTAGPLLESFLRGT
jgi:cell division protein FtsI/penicillin-binding protein 2